MKLEFAAIRRKTEFSPNHELNDLLIINQTADYLRSFGAVINFYDEDGINEDTIKENLIFSMVQGPTGISQLLKLSQSKINPPLIINSPESVFACYRTNMLFMLPKGGIPIPKTLLVSTNIVMNGEISQFNSDRLWVKRGDVHAIRREDVISIQSNHEQLKNTLKDFRDRQIGKVVLQEHVTGDTVKFYAVRETDFFYWYYTDNKFTNTFNESKLKEIANASAEILGLYVYGGDAIIGSNGEIVIIDINDWPSFAPIRNVASEHIAKLLFSKAKEYVMR
jgi:hypothetical protein